MKFTCWLDGCADRPLEVEAYDEQDAACEACDAWMREGIWKGQRLPDRYTVFVRYDAITYRVQVVAEYEITFVARGTDEVEGHRS